MKMNNEIPEKKLTHSQANNLNFSNSLQKNHNKEYTRGIPLKGVNYASMLILFW